MLDIFTGAIELFAAYFLGNRNRVGFLINLLTELCWFYVAITHELYGMLLTSLPALFLFTRGFFSWKTVK